MTDLLDIAPATSVEVVKIAGGRRLTVRGLRINDLAAIAARFPQLVAKFAVASDNVVMLFSSFGAAAVPVIAAGCGHVSDEKSEKIIDTFVLEDQLKLFKAIFWLTFPNGLGSFMEVMGSLMAEPVEKQVKVKVRSRKLPSKSPLIRNGFPPDHAMNLTWRQLDAYLEFIDALDNLDRAGNLMVATVAAQGDQKAREQMFKQLTKQWR